MARMNLHLRIGVISACVILLLAAVSSVAFAQRELRWDRLDVAAHLDADGTLNVSETQTIVFDGDWNGGERRFTIHPRHKLTFVGLSRIDASGNHELREDDSLDDVDEYAWTDSTTLRWRSRVPGDPPFANTTLRYEIRYALSGILLRDDNTYTLDHDFAFRDRDGVIERFALRLTVDPVWQPVDELRSDYTAGPFGPGKTFVLTVPLRYTGAGTPSTLDLTRPTAIAVGVPILLVFTTLAILWFFVREHLYGRFEPVSSGATDEAWLQEYLLCYPAEVVGAAWDEWVGPPEVLALLARLELEGKVGSAVGNKSGASAPMTLWLKADRETLIGHERALIDALFFDGRTETSTKVVKAHYRKSGFNPASVIAKDLRRAVEAMMPAGDAPRRFRWLTPILIVAGMALLLLEWRAGTLTTPMLLVPLVALAVAAGAGLGIGSSFRRHLEWGRAHALASVAPALAIAAGIGVFLWFYVGVGRAEMLPHAVYGLLAAAAGFILMSINASKSQQRRQGMALRKRLTAARAFFIAELHRPQPALRDEWYPWLLAFGLGKEMDQWSADRPGEERRRSGRTKVTSSSSSSSSTGDGWSGFGGGRSGGAGGGAAWQAAASGMAAGVSSASSSGSGSGSSSGGSSSSGSSGGGGGGGW
jgi:hypothetical protein